MNMFLVYEMKRITNNTILPTTKIKKKPRTKVKKKNIKQMINVMQKEHGT